MIEKNHTKSERKHLDLNIIDKAKYTKLLVDYCTR